MPLHQQRHKYRLTTHELKSVFLRLLAPPISTNLETYLKWANVSDALAEFEPVSSRP